MLPEILAVIREISLEAIKVLGPAIITAVVGYRMGKVQLDLKLREVSLNSELTARTSLFEYYKEKLSRLDKEYQRLSEELSRFLGLTTSSEDDAPELIVFQEIVRHYVSILPIEIKMVRSDMEKFGLMNNDFYRELENIINYDKSLIEDINPQAFLVNVMSFLEAYHLLYRCTGLLLEKQAEQLFSPYLRGDKK